MLTNYFDYQLPAELIAKEPLAARSASRLLHLVGNSNQITHSHFYELRKYLQPNDLLIMNNSKVIPARLFGHKATGGKVEVMLERLLTSHEALAKIRASKAPLVNSRIIINHNIEIEIVARVDDLFKIKFLSAASILQVLDQVGQLPLPPYLGRAAVAEDEERYQTVYAQHLGSVAAPTAGLHFDLPLLQQITSANIDIEYITLHVGAGTFQPVRVANIQDHHMHTEIVSVSAAVCAKIAATKAKGGRVVAVGTTTVRALETAALTGALQAYTGETNIFITPGFNFRVIDAVITNFHLPRSTLLMLTCAFGGTDNILAAYQEAIAQRYRFYSYGDAMFITRRTL